MLLLKIIFIISSTAWVSCTIAGLSYMDPINMKQLRPSPATEDLCNPLYWYPRQIPEYCYYKNNPKPNQKPMPVPLPIPIPLPHSPFPIPMPMGPMPPMFPAPPPYPISPGYPMPAQPFPMSPLPIPIYPQPAPLPYGIPLAPTNPMLPVAGVPMSYPSPFAQYRPRYQAGMVPGIPGIVTHDGGINILPFSDAYADLLEKHKQKMIQKKIKRVLEEYDDYPRRKAYKGCSH